MEKFRKEKSKDMKKTNTNFMIQTLSLNKIKTTKGITLIALVITIIVLLILAGVTIATLTGENGILTRASEASERTKQANAEEQVQLAVVASIGTDGNVNLENLNKELEKIGAYYNENPISTEAGNENKIAEGDLPATVTLDGQEVTISISGDVVLGGKIKEYTDEGVPIPNGFYYVGGTKDTGVVISDNFNDENVYQNAENGIVGTDLQGNQFVWVPVTYSDFQRYDGYYDGQYDEGFVAVCEEADEDRTNDKLAETETTQKEAQKMYASVEANGGFYVGRYEAGKENGNVVEKQGKEVYNYVTWSRNGQMNEEDTEIANGVDGTKDGAVELARNFDTANNYISVASTLIYGVQWDAIMTWIEPRYKDASNEDALIAEKNFVANSEGRGNYDETGSYNGSLATTGSKKEYAVNNIYDLAGNVAEWTMESYGHYARINRGGSCNCTGSNNPASTRHLYGPYNSDADTGFRVTLYL